jgi:hypothetical protein
VRLAEFQNGNPQLLKVVYTEPGDRSREAQLQTKFSALHYRGEWFMLGAEIINYIKLRQQKGLGQTYGI